MTGRLLLRTDLSVPTRRFRFQSHQVALPFSIVVGGFDVGKDHMTLRRAPGALAGSKRAGAQQDYRIMTCSTRVQWECLSSECDGGFLRYFAISIFFRIQFRASAAIFTDALFGGLFRPYWPRLKCVGFPDPSFCARLWLRKLMLWFDLCSLEFEKMDAVTSQFRSLQLELQKEDILCQTSQRKPERIKPPFYCVCTELFVLVSLLPAAGISAFAISALFFFPCSFIFIFPNPLATVWRTCVVSSESDFDLGFDDLRFALIKPSWLTRS